MRPCVAGGSGGSGGAGEIFMIVVDDLGYADLSCTGLAKDLKK